MKLHGTFFAASAVFAFNAYASDASACGGCFVNNSETTVVTGHRMAMAISMTQSVLWDQIEYAGAPEEFSWVLPVKKGAKVELSNDAWFEALDAATSTQVVEPVVFCDNFDGGGSSGFGCGSQDSVAMSAEGARGAEGSPVTVVHQGTVGPYETVTLATDVPGALNGWLEQHGYGVPKDIQPVIDSYVKEGFDFIALRLIPGVNVQHMKPVRVVTPGAGVALPLRMVAAGAGAKTALKLFVIGEGRYASKNFENAIVPRDQVIWNFDTKSSNFNSLRTAALEKSGGSVFISAYAQNGALLSQLWDDAAMSNVSYQIGNPNDGLVTSTIAGAYFMQALANGDAPDGGISPKSCENRATAHQATSSAVVVDNCDDEGVCAELGGAEISASEFACAQLDDLAVAFTGMHPGDVWVTRLEAELPRSALATDLVLEASKTQALIGARFTAPVYVNGPCEEDAAAVLLPPKPKNNGMGGTGSVVVLGLAAGALAIAMRRRVAVRVAG
ncbi:MAG: DUF2330 domain-containing protein [Myxococcales bacterium]|nr:DUF2330 domain-containing protein [Myxococcales bacterium]